MLEEKIGEKKINRWKQAAKVEKPVLTAKQKRNQHALKYSNRSLDESLRKYNHLLNEDPEETLKRELALFNTEEYEYYKGGRPGRNEGEWKKFALRSFIRTLDDDQDDDYIFQNE